MKNKYEILVGAEKFIDSLKCDLDDCHDSLYVQFMTYEGDEAGKRFSAPLMERAIAGVDVRLMVDYYSDVVVSDIYPMEVHRYSQLRAERAETQSLFAQMEETGIEIKRTAPFGCFGQYIFFRDHKKIVVLDEQVAYIGGINISDHNFRWHDFMVRVEGPIVQDIVRDFISTWDGKTVAFDTPAENGDYLLNQSAARHSVFNEVLAMVERAEHTIFIETPYLLGDTIERAILRAAERGVKVQLIVPYNNNKLIFKWWSAASVHRLNHPNISYYGFTGHDGMTHAKLYLFDGRWTTVGSLNVFELECLMQKEVNIFSDNPDLVAQVKELAEADLAQSELLSLPSGKYLRFTHTAVYGFFTWWTKRLSKNPDWVAKYC